MTNRIGYARCSTSQQNLDVQIEALKPHTDLIVPDVGTSGGLPLEEREQLLRAIEMVHAGGQLVVLRRDRLARNPETSAIVKYILAKKQAKVVYLEDPETPTGPAEILMAQILDALAAYERGLIRLRIRQHFAAAKMRGEDLGRPPFGWKIDEQTRKFVPIPEKQKLISFILKCTEEGHRTRELPGLIKQHLGIDVGKNKILQIKRYSAIAREKYQWE